MDNDSRLRSNILATAKMLERILNTPDLDPHWTAARMKFQCEWPRVQLVLETIDRIFSPSARSGPLFVRCYDVWPNLSLADMALLANFMIQRETIATIDGRKEFIPAEEEMQPTGDHPLNDLVMGLRTERSWNEYMAQKQIMVPSKRLKESMRKDNEGECRICQESVPLNTYVSTLPCGHWYCRGCIGEWLKNNTTCPTCRRDIYT